jgi:hypothetical protein
VGILKPKFVFALAAIVVALMVAIPGISAQDPPAVEEFTAFAINVNRRPTGTTGANRPTTATLTFRIERWSTDEERESLMAIVKEESNVNRANQQLLRTLGWIRETGTVSWDLRFAQQTSLPEGGRRIVLGTDRPIGFWEARNQPRTIDYPFTILQFQLDKNNQGEGKMIADTRLIWQRDSNTLVLENFDISPVRLNQIRRR